jgi:hypothetical protein
MYDYKQTAKDGQAPPRRREKPQSLEETFAEDFEQEVTAPGPSAGVDLENRSAADGGFDQHSPPARQPAEAEPKKKRLPKKAKQPPSNISVRLTDVEQPISLAALPALGSGEVAATMNHAPVPDATPNGHAVTTGQPQHARAKDEAKKPSRKPLAFQEAVKSDANEKRYPSIADLFREWEAQRSGVTHQDRSLSAALPVSPLDDEDDSDDSICDPDVDRHDGLDVPDAFEDDSDATSNRLSDNRRSELALRAMFESGQPSAYSESDDAARVRLQKVCDIAVAFGLDDSRAMEAVSEYLFEYPLPVDEDYSSPIPDERWDVCVFLDNAKCRVERGAALLPANLVITMGAIDRNGSRPVSAKLGDDIHFDFFDPRKDFLLSKFAAAACEALGLEWAENQIKDLVREKAGGNHTSALLEKYDIGEMLQQFPQRRPVVIDGLAREGETMNAISHSKIGKSWMICQLALSIVTGLLWLGRFATSKGRVLIVDNELPREELAHRVRVVAQAMAINLSDLAGQIEIWSLRDNHRSLDELQAEFDAIDPGTFRLVVLDALYKLLPPVVSENDNAAMAQFHARVSSIASRIGAAVAMVHHASKGSQEGKRLTDVGAGAGAQSRAVDCHLVLREHEKDGVLVLNAAVRSFPPVEPLPLQLTFPLLLPIDGVDPAQLRVEPSAQNRRQQAMDREGKEKIREALRKTGPATARQLRVPAGLGPDRLQRLLDMMQHDDEVTAANTTVKGNKTNLYSLPASQK